MSTRDPFASWRTRPLPEYVKPPKPHCPKCGGVMREGNKTCEQCKSDLRKPLVIDPFWIALCENATDQGIEKIGDILAGRRPKP